MRFPKKDPHEGSEKRATWTFESWRGGGYEAGWLGGEVVWLDTHHDGVTKPCHSFLTQGAVACPYCHSGRAVTERGYVPWIGATGKPLCSLVAKSIRPLVDLIQRYDAVTVGKGRSKYKPVYVRPRANAEKWQPTPGTQTTGDEFEAWLLQLWGVAALIEFFATDKPVSPTAAPPVGVPPAVAARSVTLVTPTQEIEVMRRLRKAAGRDGAPGGGMMPIGDSLPPVPSANGKHPGHE